MISAKQRKILAFPFSRYDALICDGAVRSGKTSLMTWAYVDWAMREFSGQRFGICGKTVDSAAKNIIQPFCAMTLAKRRYTLRWRRSDKILEVTRGAASNLFEVFGGKDESSYMLIQGRTLAGVLLDEVVLMPESFVNQALARCSVDGARLWFSCNPGSPQHWFYRDWICRRQERNALYLHFEMEDNPSLSDKVRADYHARYTGVFYDRYVLGKWVAAEGVIYRPWADSLAAGDGRYLWPEERPLRPARVVIGVDFGGSGSKHAFVATGVLPDWRGCVALAARRIEPGDVDALTREFMRFAGEVFARWGEIAAVYCDSAEQTIIRQLRAELLRSPLAWLAPRLHNARKAPILDRIRLTSILIGGGRLWYLPEAQTLATALAEALWRTRTDGGADERLDDGTTDVDSLDAFEYTIERDAARYLSAGSKQRRPDGFLIEP